MRYAVEVNQLAGNSGVCRRSQRLETRRSGFVEGLLVDEPFDVILGDLGDRA